MKPCFERRKFTQIIKRSKDKKMKALPSKTSRARYWNVEKKVLESITAIITQMTHAKRKQRQGK